MAKSVGNEHRGGYSAGISADDFSNAVESGRQMRETVFHAVSRGSADGAEHGGAERAVEAVVRDMTGHSPEHRLNGVVNQPAYERMMRGVEGAFVDRSIRDYAQTLEGHGVTSAGAVESGVSRADMRALAFGGDLERLRGLQEAMSFEPRFVERDYVAKAELHAVLGTSGLKALAEGGVETTDDAARGACRDGERALAVLEHVLPLNADLVDDSSVRHVQAMKDTVHRMGGADAGTTFVEPGLVPPAQLSAEGLAAVRAVAEVLEALPDLDRRFLEYAGSSVMALAIPDC